jgi:hypothetical protein
LSYSLDLNVLLLASNAESDEYAAARTFIDQCAARPEVLCLAWPTVMGYLRIATHPTIFTRPLSSREALGNIQELLSLPQTRTLSEQEGFLSVYEAVAGTSVRCNLVPDAHLAAILLQHGVTTLYTKDAGFRRFDFLDIRKPF